jgi:hypothetical protein
MIAGISSVIYCLETLVLVKVRIGFSYLISRRAF